MINRIKKILELSKKDPKVIDSILKEDIEKLPDEGDGNAVFFGEGTHEEFEEFEKEESGMNKWYNRLKNL